MQPASISQHCPARKVSGVLSRVMVISPPSTNSRASKSWQWLAARVFGRRLALTTLKPSRRSSVSNSRRSIDALPGARRRSAIDWGELVDVAKPIFARSPPVSRPKSHLLSGMGNQGINSIAGLIRSGRRDLWVLTPPASPPCATRRNRWLRRGRGPLAPQNTARHSTERCWSKFRRRSAAALRRAPTQRVPSRL